MKCLGFLLLAVIATTTCQAQLRYRPGVSYAYQYRTERIAPVDVPKIPLVVPVVPVVPIVHVQALGTTGRPSTVRPAPTLHFPTRRPMQALDRLHTRIDIGRHQMQQHRRVATLAIPVGTVVAHSHTQIFRKLH